MKKLMSGVEVRLACSSRLAHTASRTVPLVVLHHLYRIVMMMTMMMMMMMMIVTV